MSAAADDHGAVKPALDAGERGPSFGDDAGTGVGGVMRDVAENEGQPVGGEPVPSSEGEFVRRRGVVENESERDGGGVGGVAAQDAQDRRPGAGQVGVDRYGMLVDIG